jgi:hypothetical protein
MFTGADPQDVVRPGPEPHRIATIVADGMSGARRFAADIAAQNESMRRAAQSLNNMGQAQDVPAAATALGEATLAADATVIPFRLPASWERERQEAIRLLTALPQALHDARAGLKLIEELRRRESGGNQDVSPRTEDMLTDVTVATDVLLTELGHDTPRPSSIRLAARTLLRVAQWIRGQAAWLAEKAAGGAVGALAGKITVDHTGEISATLTRFATDVEHAVAPVVHLFTTYLHMPF